MIDRFNKAENNFFLVKSEDGKYVKYEDHVKADVRNHEDVKILSKNYNELLENHRNMKESYGRLLKENYELKREIDRLKYYVSDEPNRV